MKWSGQTVQAVADQWVVGLADAGVSLSALQADLAAQGLGWSELSRIGSSQFARLTTSGVGSDDLEAWSAGRDDVLYVEPNFARRLDETLASQTPNDSSFASLWGLNNTGQTGGTSDADIDAPEAWGLTTGSASVVVGIIDTGIDYTHPDLAANVWTNPGEIAGDGIDNDHNGYVDDVHGYDFAHSSSDPMDRDQHGTHVAGTIGAVGNNSRGVTGINWNVRLMALGVLSDGGWIEYDDTIEALSYATMMKRDHGINVVVTNNSWGGGSYDTGLRDAFAAAGAQGILCICAAGNGGNDGIGDNNDAWPFYPAGYNLDNIIAVAATDHNDRLTSWSNYGAQTVDLAAPGNSIYSTIPGGQYASFSGTSMATPHVTGVVALLAAANPSATAAQLKSAVLAGVDRPSALSGKVLTNGRLNAYGALQALGGGGGGGDTTAPRVAGVSPPATSTPVDTITVDFSEDILNSSVVAANFALRSNGADNTFDTADDTVYTISSSGVSEIQAGRARIQLGQTLPTENYRLTIRGTGSNPIRDLAGNALNGGADEVYLFRIQDSSGPAEPNDTIAQAAATGLSGPGTVTFSGYIGDGAQGTRDIDLYRFEARAGDVVTADIDARAIGSALDPMLRLFDSAGYEIAYNDDHDGLDSYIQTTLPATGTYYLGVSAYPNSSYSPGRAGSGGAASSVGDYQLRIDVAGDTTPPDPNPDPGDSTYLATPVSPTFEDIRRTGRLGLARPSDDQYFVLTPNDLRGFQFSFYGQPQTYVYVSSNGLITFGMPDTAYENTDLTASPSTAAIAALWDDLVVNGSRNSAVLWEVRGSGSDQRLIVQWNDVRFYNGRGAGQITFQAVLYEADGAIQLNYLDLACSFPGAEGAAATVGIKDFGPQAAGEHLLRLSFNDGPNQYVGTGRSTRITPAQSGQASQPVQITTPAGTDTIQGGSTYRIQWSGGGPGATVDLWRYGADGWCVLAQNVPAAGGGLDWNTAGAPQGWYYFGAQVHDGAQDYSAVSPQWLHVVSPYNRAATVAVTSPGESQEILRGQPVTITWDASDPDGDTLHAVVWAHSDATGWFQVPGGEALDASVGSITWDTTDATPGAYTFSVWVGDQSGWTSADGAGQVRVALPTAWRPSISLSIPGADAWLLRGQPIEIDWDVDAPAGLDLSVYLWIQDSWGYWSQINTTPIDASAGRYVLQPYSLASGVYTVAAWLGGYGDFWASALSPDALKVL